mmetsp:Transcript_56236/g.131727  ORF Transcript_56236/g.131727 Transcript_56236/m.131727 type:complete len:250 (-) Transcript_56236:123-872(-)
MDRLEKVGNKRLLDREEIRDACSASSQLLPDGMFAKAVKVLIWQGQLLRGLAQTAVQTELRSVLEMAWEQKESQNKRRRCNSPSDESDAANRDKQEQVASSESKRNFDLDDFLAPSCRACGWPTVGCSCVWEQEGNSLASKVFSGKGSGKKEVDEFVASNAETKRGTGKNTGKEAGKEEEHTKKESQEPSKPKAPPAPRDPEARELERKRGGEAAMEAAATPVSNKALPRREPSARERRPSRRAAGICE